MARTRDPIAHAIRRDTFVDAGLTIIQSRGYEQLSVAEIIDSVGASKGAFYHYFDSKADLLDAVVERMVETVVGILEQVVADPELPATRKLEAIFTTVGQWKTDRRELLLEVMRVCLSDDNAVVREHLRRSTAARMTPLLGAIIGQGVAEGTFSVRSPESAAAVYVSLILGANETATRLFVERQAGAVTFEQVGSTLAAYGDAFERVLGLPAGTLPFIQSPVLHEWFG